MSYSEHTNHVVKKELTMVDSDTFLTTLYVIVDEYCKSDLAAAPPRHGPQASLPPQ
jgi:hypothetical protein